MSQFIPTRWLYTWLYARVAQSVLTCEGSGPFHCVNSRFVTRTRDDQPIRHHERSRRKRSAVSRMNSVTEDVPERESISLGSEGYDDVIVDLDERARFWLSRARGDAIHVYRHAAAFGGGELGRPSAHRPNSLRAAMRGIADAKIHRHPPRHTTRRWAVVQLDRPGRIAQPLAPDGVLVHRSNLTNGLRGLGRSVPHRPNLPAAADPARGWGMARAKTV